MPIRKCKLCGKEFYATGTQAYCKGPHYKTCVVCGEQFEFDHKNPKNCCSRKCSAELRKRTITSKPKICKICGEEFYPRNNTQEYCDKDHYRSCPVCGKPVLVKAAYAEARTCSEECRQKLRRQTNLERFGVEIASQSDEVRQKLHDVTQTDEYKQKRAQTSMERFGVDNVAKAAEVRQKISATVKSKECQDRMRNTTYERYGVRFAMQNKDLLKKYSDTIQEKYGTKYYCMTDDCRNSQGHTISRVNREVAAAINKYGYETEFEYRIDAKSFDIYVPELKLLIEVDPTYTHTVLGNHWSDGLPATYQRDKTKLAESQGLRCVHLFDWDCYDDVLSMLFEKKETVYARNCELKELDKQTTEEFEHKYHLQGSCRGQQIRLGLYHDNQLIQVMTFGKPRYNKKYEWELLRLCTSFKYRVVGGAEKLFKYFLTTQNPQSIISYCDYSKFRGDVYTRLGFTHQRTHEPAKIWSKNSEKITDNLLRSRGYDQLFGTSYGKGTSNEQLMIENKWLPVYDCGQDVYVYGDNLSVDESKVAQSVEIEEIHKKHSNKPSKKQSKKLFKLNEK